MVQRWGSGMFTPEAFKVAATITSLLGSIILAIRVAGILKALALVAKAHEANIAQILSGSRDIVYFQNSTKHVENANKLWLLCVGFGCLIISGFLQLVSLFWA